MSASTTRKENGHERVSEHATVVLVHGGFADASFWVPVIKDLQAHDLPVLAPPNPLRGLSTHLYRIYPKLGISARSQLAVALSETP